MQRSISVVAFVLFMSPLGIAISPIAVSCVNQFVRQHFMKSGKCVKWTSLACTFCFPISDHVMPS